MICRQLGFTRADKMFTGSHFGRVNGKFSFDMVKCVGNESSIGQCLHWDLADCEPTEVAGVSCVYLLPSPNLAPGKFLNYLQSHSQLKK